MITTTSEAITRIMTFLRTVPQEVGKVASSAIAEYLIGDVSHGLRHYPPYKHIPWSQIGGFISEHQRRYVMAQIKEGNITPGISASNGYFCDAWQYRAQGNWFAIYNDVSYAPYLVGQGTQSRRAILQGWRTVYNNIRDNTAGALRHAMAAINQWMKANIRR